MSTATYQLEIKPGRFVTAKMDGPESGDKKPGVILAHGMANDLDHELLEATARRLGDAGIAAVRFNFLYREEGKKNADGKPTLMACLRAVYEDALTRWNIDPERIAIGGKSLGARISSEAAKEGLPSAAMIYLGYPLQPPGRPELTREDLITALDPKPQLFFAGTRDNLCPLDNLNNVLAKLKGPHDLHVIEGGDHSFKTPKSDPRTQDEIHEHIAELTVNWVRGYLDV